MTQLQFFQAMLCYVKKTERSLMVMENTCYFLVHFLFYNDLLKVRVLPHWLRYIGFLYFLQESVNFSLRVEAFFSECQPKGPYYKSKLDLKSNWSEILPVNCRFVCVIISFLFSLKVRLKKIKFVLP